MLNIQQKIVVLSCIVTWAATLGIGVVDYRGDVGQARQQAQMSLGQQARFVDQQIQYRLAKVVHDATLISKALALQDLDNQTGGTGLAALTTAQREQLTRVLRIIMQTRPAYSEMALINQSRAGGDIARLMRMPTGILTAHRAPAGAAFEDDLHRLGRSLQPGSWDFVDTRDGLAGTPLAPFRIHDRVFLMNLPTLEGRPVAYLLVRIDLRSLIPELLREMAPTHPTYVLGEDGEFLGGAGSGGVRPQQQPDTPYAQKSLPAAFLFAKPGPPGEVTLLQENDTAFLALHGGGEDLRVPRYQVIVSQGLEEMFAIPREAARKTLLVGGLATFLSGLLAGIFAIWITRPISQMVHAVKTYERSEPPKGLPTHLRDEVGDLARAFESLIDRLGGSESRAMAILESITDALIIIDPEGKVMEFSDIAEQMFGCERAEIVGRNISVLMPEPHRSRHDAYLARFRQLSSSNVMDRTRELVARRRTGEIFPIELTVSILKGGNGPAYVGTIRDISARKRADEMKDQFISAVNHELRTPLTSILAALSLLRDHAAEHLDDRAQRLMELSVLGANRLTELINDILDRQKIREGMLTYTLSTHDIRTVVTDVVRRHQPLAERSGVVLAVECDGDPIEVEIDPSRFEQALVNLLANAVRISPHGETVTVSVICRDQGCVRVDVADNGPGIPEDEQETLFTGFDPKVAEQGGSTPRRGLGLAIARSMIEALGGTITYDTEPDRGTIFHIDLPIRTFRPEETGDG